MAYFLYLVCLGEGACEWWRAKIKDVSYQVIVLQVNTRPIA